MDVMYVFLGLLIALLLYSLHVKEAFTLHIEGGDFLTPLTETVKSAANGMTDGLHKNIIRPAYDSMIGFVPYRHHYRKLRRQFYSK